jgi:hypothetical protein
MPITLNNSNISVTYNTGSNYIIETVKSDLYVRDTVGTTSNLYGEPTVSPSIGTDIIVESFTYTTGTNTTNYTKNFSQNTICDILLVGGGGGGGHNHGGGGGAGAVVFIKSVVLNSGSYTIQVGKGGAKGTRSTTNFGGLKGNDTKITFNGTDILKAEGGGGGSQGSATGSIGNGGSGGGGDGYRDALSVYNNGVVGTGSIKDYNGTTGVLYGNNGGSYYLASSGGYLNIAGAGGGGGGAGQIGSNATKCNVAGNAGNGISSATINGITYNFVDMFGTTYGTNDDSNNTTRYFGGGGGGGTWDTQGTAPAADTGPTVIAGSGGKGGGGAGALQEFATGFDGSANTGGGGGGGSYNSTDSRVDGGNGGSGIVIIRYRNLATAPTSINMIKTLNFNYYSLPPTIYTLNFPTRTIVTINNGIDKLLNGSYTITLGNTLSTIVPTTTNQNLQDTKYSSSNISISYHLLNPILDLKGAQWTYSSSNTNVYHLGSVGIGTTSPEYTLDVRGNIFTSVGGYTQTGTENWIIQSDRRIKENIVKASYEKCLDNIKKIELYNFNFKENYVKTNDRNQLGFIAQEVREVYPKAVMVKPDGRIEELLTLNTTQIKYTLYGAVKSLIEKVENLEMRVDKLYKIAIPDVDIIEIFESTSNISIITSNISTSNLTTNSSK